jgi:hypothetical protein
MAVRVTRRPPVVLRLDPESTVLYTLTKIGPAAHPAVPHFLTHLSADKWAMGFTEGNRDKSGASELR